jgi:hypothetical protein
MLAEPEGFPWAAQPPLDLLFGTSSARDDDDDASAAVLLPGLRGAAAEGSGSSSGGGDGQTLSPLAVVASGKRYLGLYFSASW